MAMRLVNRADPIIKAPIAFALITAYTVHLLCYPMFADHFARAGDLHAAAVLRRWEHWKPAAIVALAGGWAISYALLRRDRERSPVLAVVMSSTIVFATVVLEIFSVLAFAYVIGLLRSRR